MPFATPLLPKEYLDAYCWSRATGGMDACLNKARQLFNEDVWLQLSNSIVICRHYMTEIQAPLVHFQTNTNTDWKPLTCYA